MLCPTRADILGVREGDVEKRLNPGVAVENSRESSQMKIISAVMDQTHRTQTQLPRWRTWGKIWCLLPGALAIMLEGTGALGHDSSGNLRSK